MEEKTVPWKIPPVGTCKECLEGPKHLACRGLCWACYRVTRERVPRRTKAAAMDRACIKQARMPGRGDRVEELAARVAAGEPLFACDRRSYVLPSLAGKGGGL
jgi:hypothetical protein